MFEFLRRKRVFREAWRELPGWLALQQKAKRLELLSAVWYALPASEVTVANFLELAGGRSRFVLTVGSGLVAGAALSHLDNR
jgi:hypothetical protein